MLNEQVGETVADTAAEMVAGAAAREEVELKLIVPADMLGRLREAPIFARHARNAGVTRRLEAIYYDTPDRSLFSRGMSLRVRRHGNRYVQTLKRGPAPGQPFVREEWETPVDNFVPDLALLPLSDIGAPFSNLDAGPFEPIFTTKIRRRTQHLDLPAAVVEVAFDEGAIEAGGRCEALAELELEVKSGSPRVLYDIGIELLAFAPLRIGTQSKSDRGYHLAFGVAPRATRATVPGITAEHTVDDIVGVLLGNCQQQILTNQVVAESGDDPEGVHQMRVALRRLRTACGLLRQELGSPTLEALNIEARWLAKILGAARDWDVFATETLSGPSSALASEAGFDGLRSVAEPSRLAAYAALRETFAGQRYNRFQLSMRHWIESRGWRSELGSRSLAELLEPSPVFACRILTRLHRKALKRGAHFRQLQPEARHRLRIALKKLRYSAEFFQGLRGKNAAAKDFLGCLAKLQETLGHDNDASTTWPVLRALADNPVAPEVQRAIGAVMGWQACHRSDMVMTLHRHWRQFKAMPTFWTS